MPARPSTRRRREHVAQGPIASRSKSCAVRRGCGSSAAQVPSMLSSVSRVRSARSAIDPATRSSDHRAQRREEFHVARTQEGQALAGVLPRAAAAGQRRRRPSARARAGPDLREPREACCGARNFPGSRFVIEWLSAWWRLRSRPRSSRRRILPTVDLGSASTKRTRRDLCSGQFLAAVRDQVSSGQRAPGALNDEQHDRSPVFRPAPRCTRTPATPGTVRWRRPRSVRIDVEAGDDDHVLLAVDDLQEPFVVEHAHVAGAEVAVAR